MWRAWATHNWNIGFRDAYVVSVKAGLGATVLAAITTFASALVVGLLFGEVGSVGEKGLVTLGSAVGIVSWLYLHANALLTAASSTHMRNVLDYHSLSLSWNVLGWIAAALGVMCLVLLLVLGVIYW